MTVEKDWRGIIRLVTTTRAELFNLSAIMAKGIAPEILADKKNALLVAVNGTYDGGKKILPDAMRRTLMTSTSLAGFKGRKEYDECWFYELNGKPVEIDFINTAWAWEDFSKPFRQERTRQNCHDNAKLMMHLREFGGITFVHNDEGFALHKAGLNISINRLYALGMDKIPESLKEAAASAYDLDWGRIVKIRVKDQRLAASAQFQQAMQEICDGGYKTAGKYDFENDDRQDLSEFKVKALRLFGMKTSAFKKMGM